MNASKENARKALNYYRDFVMAGNTDPGEIEFVEELLMAAEKRLPSEEAIARDKERKRKNDKFVERYGGKGTASK